MSRLLKIGLVICAALAFSKCFGQNLEVLSEPLFHGSYYSVAVSGDHAIFSAHGHLLSVSFADPASPEVTAIRRFQTGGSAAFLLGDYVYFAGGLEASAAIVDIANPSDPRTVALFNTRQDARGICARGDYAYVPDYSGQVIVANVANPANPYVESRINTCDEAFCVAVQGDYLYVGHQDSGLTVIDVANAANPSIVGRAISDSSGHHSFSDIDISGSYAYLADYYGGLRIFDISNPVLPVYISTIRPDSNGVSRVLVDSNLAYCVSSRRHLYIIDVANPLVPSLVGDFYIENDDPRSLAIFGNRLFLLGNERHGLYGYINLLDISNRVHPSILGSYQGCPFSPYYVALRGNYAFVGSSGLYALDISDPSHPVKIGEFLQNASHVVISDSTAFAFTDSSRLVILDISNPESLRVLGLVPLSWDPRDIVASRGYVFVGYGTSGFDIIDFSNPSAPRNVRRFNSGTDISSMIWQGNYLYAKSDLQIFDVSDPENPVAIGSCTPPYPPMNFCIAGNYAYLVSWDTWHQSGRLTIIDVTDKANPFYLSQVETAGRPGGIYAEGDYVFLTEYENLIEVVDVSNPYSPAIVSSRDSFSPGSELIVRDNILYVGGDLSLTILEFQEPVAVRDNAQPLAGAFDFKCFPNPSNSSFSFDYALEEKSHVILSIYDISGRLLETIINESQTGGAHRAAWEARDVSSGVYFARMTTDAKSSVREIILLK